MAQTSFSSDIKPLFRPIDISHMKSKGIVLDDYTYMSNPDNANRVYATLLPHDGKPALHAARRTLLDAGPTRVVRSVAEGGIPAVKLCTLGATPHHTIIASGQSFGNPSS